MTEQQAIEFATENGVTVTTDCTHRDSLEVSFKVGTTTVVRNKGRRLWRVGGSHALLPRGIAIRVAVGIELKKRHEGPQE